jgi:hypothetical protein
VISLTLMILLTVLAVGMLSLSAISLRSASGQRLQEQARANARLALMLALGDLQKLAGPDQRVTASSQILSSPTGSEEIARPHMAGVWRSWKQQPQGGGPDYSQRKQDDFLGWLTSGKTPGDAVRRDFASSTPAADSLLLVGPGTQSAAATSLRAERLTVAADAGQKGACAWVVLDQGQKAQVSLPEVPQPAMDQRLAGLAAPGGPAFEAVTGRDWSALETLGDGRLKLISHPSLQLAGVPRESAGFHDLTSLSIGLPVDVTSGKFATDLSLLFDEDKLPDDYQGRFLYSGTTTPLASAPRRFAGANPLPHPDPMWSLLQSHARAFSMVSSPASRPALQARADVRPAGTAVSSRTPTADAFTRQQFAPVIARAQFVFSIGFGASPTQAAGRREAGAATGEDWICWLVIDPVITLWNPYDVSLTFADGMIELYRVPLAYQLFRNGQSFAPPTLFANSFLSADFQTRQNRYYRLNLKPKEGESAITLRPGEHRVFTAHNHVKHYNEAYFRVGVDLRPGWNEPAGQQSSRDTGGISSLNTFVGNAAENSGRINGVAVRSLPVKAGDRITLRVTPAGADIDKFAETNNQEITAMLRYRINPQRASSSSALPPLVGAIELDYGSKEKEWIPTLEQRDLPTLIVPGGIPKNEQGDNYAGSRPPPAVRFKEPFLVSSLHLKTALDSRFPARGWMHSAPTNLYASAGLDQLEDFRHHQYEFNWEAMTDWKSSPTIEIDSRDRGFGGSGIYAQTGQSHAVFASVPLAPLLSLGQLRHAPLNAGGQLPLQSQIVGNSHASPLLPPASVMTTATSGRTLLDHSWLANQALFDAYFFSGAGTSNDRLGAQELTAAARMKSFLQDGGRLSNPRITPLPEAAVAENASVLTESPARHETFATQLGIAGAFNVNSTSVAAWQALLGSLQETQPPSVNVETGALGTTSGEGTLASRHLPPTGEARESTTDPARSEIMAWAGHRRLSDEQLEKLAREIVVQVKQRGPFQSLAEFVNRRLEAGELGRAGALQAAIEKSGVNAEVLAGALTTLAAGGAAHPEAAIGSTADGAPGVLNQADLLTPFAPFARVRSDTFLVRTCGEARAGDTVVRVWCEALVQRMPDFVDPSTPRQTAGADLPADSPNARFGRRFEIISFRWLSPAEV